MRTDLRSSILWLAPDQLLELREARGGRVTTVIGEVWVTQDGDLRDIVLGAGESYRIERDGVTLVQALYGAAYVLVEEGAAARMLDPNGHGETLVAPEAAPSVRLHRWARHAQAHAVASVIGAGIVATARAVQRAARQFFALKPPATAQLPR